jgi:curved DNA-binding protein CbpA
MTRNECCGILEIPLSATREEVVQAYRHLVQVWHPDRFGNNPDLQVKANAKLCQINETYAILMNEEQQAAGAERNEAADTGSFIPYRDDQLQYLGRDPRLPATRSRISCVIELRQQMRRLPFSSPRMICFIRKKWSFSSVYDT